MKATRARLVALVLLVATAAVAAGGVVGAGEPPLADAGLDQQVEQNATVLLDAAGSRDPDGELRSYSWSIETPGGRTIRPADPDAPRTSFVARQPGRYEVTVTVTNEDGQSASDTLYVDVAPRADTGPADPPVSTPGDTTPGLPESSSPVSDGVVDPATPDAPLPTATSDLSGGETAASSSGPVCRSGATQVGPFGCLQGEDPPATVEVQGELYVRQGSVHTYTAIVEDRPSGNERLSWSGGIGTGNTLTRMFTESPGSTVTITATVDDGEGHTTSDSIVVHVVSGNSPPEVRIEGPTQACVGDPVELEGYAITSEDSDEITDATWHGDPTFVPQGPGRYEVGFSAMDRQGQTAKTTHTVTVREDGGCGTEIKEKMGEGRRADKLLIRAADDNWVEGSGVSLLMRTNGKVPESGALEKLADIGAAGGKFGEASAEFVTGNRETMVVTMSAENASKLAQRINTTATDDTVAGADGPRINEHERLKNARVKDPVETENGQVKVVIRIGEDNEGSPDQYKRSESTSEREAMTGRREQEQTETSEATEATESAEPSLAPSDEQTNVLEHSGPADTVNQVADTVSDTVGSAIGSLVGRGTDSGASDEGRSDASGTDSMKSDDSPNADGSKSGDRSPTTGSESSGESDTGSTGGSITDAFSGLLGGESSGSSGTDDDSGGGSADSDSDSGMNGDSAWGGLI